MAANEDQLPLSSTFTYTPPDPLPSSPFIPSPDEAEYRYYGIPSRPYFVARSSHDVWTMPTGMEAYMPPKELHCVGQHSLCDVWEGKVDIAMHSYLVRHNIPYTSLDPVRIGFDGSAPVIIWVGVKPGSLSAERGVEISIGLRAFLVEYGIEDVHIEIRESIVSCSAKLYKPTVSSNPTFQVREPFSTTLGITICAENTPNKQGTATLFFTVCSKPHKLFLLAAKHVLFPEDENEHYEYKSSGPRRNVLLLGTNGYRARIKDIKEKVKGNQADIEGFMDRLVLADTMEDLEEAQRERENVQLQLDQAERAIKPLEKFLVDVKRDWEDPKNRIIGHVVLSPPLILHAGNGGFTQDFAVIEVDTTKIDATNFIGNAIDLGTEIPVETLKARMHPNATNQPSFKYPPDRLLHFTGILSNDEMHRPGSKMSRGIPVLKRGCGSGLTVGYINNIHSILRKAFINKPNEYSNEVAVLPYSPQAFSTSGDSGAAVVNGSGAIAGLLTGGSLDGRKDKKKFHDASDNPEYLAEYSEHISYVTPISFLLERLEAFGFQANLFPGPADDVFASV